MNEKTASKQFRAVRLALLAAVVLLGGCATHSTRYYAEDAGYGYYESGYGEAAYGDPWYGGASSSVSIYLGSSYGYRDPWVYPYGSLDLFYFGPYAYSSSFALYSPWVYAPYRYRYPYDYGYGSGPAYAGGFGFGYYGLGWPRWSAPYYYPHSYGYSGYGDRSHDRHGNSGRYRYDDNENRFVVDDRVRALSNEPSATPTRRALLGSRQPSGTLSRVTGNPSRTQLISNGSTRAALRGELGADQYQSTRTDTPRSTPAQRSRLLTPANSANSDRPTGDRSGGRSVPIPVQRDESSRRALSTGTSRSELRSAPRQVAPRSNVQSRAIQQNRDLSQRRPDSRSQLLDQSAANRSANLRSTPAAVAPRTRVQSRAPTPVRQSEPRVPQAAPAPRSRAYRAPVSERPAPRRRKREPQSAAAKPSPAAVTMVAADKRSGRSGDSIPISIQPRPPVPSGPALEI